MEINYENLIKLVDKIPLSNDHKIIYEVDGVSIFITHNLHLSINGREYKIDELDIPVAKAFGFPVNRGKPGLIAYHYDSLDKEKRAYILHELAELELIANGSSKNEAHKIAKEYEIKYTKG